MNMIFTTDHQFIPLPDYSFSHLCTNSQYQKEYQLVTVDIFANVQKSKDKVGEASIYLIDERWIESNLYTLAETVDPYLAEALRSVRIIGAGSKGIMPTQYVQHVYGRLAVLRDFQIYEKFRGKGIGRIAIQVLLEYLSDVVNVSFVIVNPNSYSMKQNDNDSKIIDFFEGAGFLSTYGTKEPHMCIQLTASSSG